MFMFFLEDYMSKKQKNSRNIPMKDRMILYSEACAQCSMEECNEDLTFPIYDGKSSLENIAHIEALNEGGARFNPNLPIEDRNSENNLMLICPNCHKKIDDDPKKYTVEYLKDMKRNHIRKMKLIKDNSSVNFNYDDLYIASKHILDEELHISKKDNYFSEDYTNLEINYKMNKNNLTNISKNNIINGIAQQHMVERFFVDMSKEDSLFFDKINASLKNCYMDLNKKYSGDSLFFQMYEHYKNGLTETQIGACLAIIVYFFTICELFEK